MNNKDLQKILKFHKKWRANDINGIRADLRYADLSSAKNIYWLKRKLVNKKLRLKNLRFEVNENYFIGYKSFNEQYESPKKWNIKEGNTIKRHIDTNIWEACSFGINIGTLEWCITHCKKQIYKVKIAFSSDICIPIYSDGKIRVSECTIMNKIDVL